MQIPLKVRGHQLSKGKKDSKKAVCEDGVVVGVRFHTSADVLLPLRLLLLVDW